MDEAQEGLSGAQHDLSNATLLPPIGIGEDNFYLNECFAEGTNLLSFETVYDYDCADHEFQEAARAWEIPSYVKRSYHGALYFSSARLFIDEVFTYGHLSMVAGHIHTQAEEHASAIVSVLILHDYVHGKDHGKRSGRGFELNMLIDAGGKEGLLDELRLCQHDYFNKRYAALAESWDQLDLRAVYLAEREVPGEVNRDFLFSDTEALRAVRFRSFLRDCRRIVRPAAELTPHVDAEKQCAEAFIRAEHKRLLRDFDPKVARLRKRRKIVVHEDAAEKFF